MFGCGLFDEAAEDGGGDEASDDVLPAFGSDHALDEARGGFAEFAWWHEEDAGEAREQVAVHVAHGAFVLVVVVIADAAEDVAGALVPGVVGEELVGEGCDLDVWEGLCDFLEPVDALFYGVGVVLLGVDRGCNDEFPEEGAALLDHPRVPVGGRVEASGVDGGVVHHADMVPYSGRGWR